MAGRVRRPPDKEELLDRLVDGNPFQTLREAIVFAAALGFARGRREPFAGTGGDPIRWELFREVGADSLAAMMAAVATDDVSVCAPDRVDERLAIFEEYANGGLAELGERLAEHPERRSGEVILDIVLRQEDTDTPTPDVDLSSIAEEFSG